MNRKRVIKLLIKFNSITIYIGVGFAVVGRTALTKGKSKYNLTKPEGELGNWTEMVVVYTSFFFSKVLPGSGMFPTCKFKAVASLALP